MERNLVYVALVSCPDVVSSGPQCAHPLMIKVGKTDSLPRRLGEHNRGGLLVAKVLGMIRKPAGGIHKCEQALKNALRAVRLGVGMYTQTGAFKRLTECYAAKLDTLGMVLAFMEAHTDTEVYGMTADPVHTYHEEYPDHTGVSALSVCDSIPGEELRVLTEYAGRDPSLIASETARRVLARYPPPAQGTGAPQSGAAPDVRTVVVQILETEQGRDGVSSSFVRVPVEWVSEDGMAQDGDRTYSDPEQSTVLDCCFARVRAGQKCRTDREKRAVQELQRQRRPLPTKSARAQALLAASPARGLYCVYHWHCA
jgi:hypothetical protein